MAHSDATGSGCSRVLVVDGLPMFRDGLRRLLATETDMGVCGEAGTLRDARRLAEELQPDLILLGGELSDGEPLTLLPAAGNRIHAKVLFLTPRGEPDAEAVAAMRLGASGVLSRQSSGDVLVRGIRRVCAGGRVLDDAIIEQLVKQRRG